MNKHACLRQFLPVVIISTSLFSVSAIADQKIDDRMAMVEKNQAIAQQYLAQLDVLQQRYNMGDKQALIEIGDLMMAYPQFAGAEQAQKVYSKALEEAKQQGPILAVDPGNLSEKSFQAQVVAKAAQARLSKLKNTQQLR